MNADMKSKYMIYKTINIKQEQPLKEITCREHFHAGYFSG